MNWSVTAASGRRQRDQPSGVAGADHDEQARVEAAYAELAAAGQPVTFAEVAARARISRTTLYRRADLCAVVEEHRARGRDATTLSGLVVQIDQLHRGASYPLPGSTSRRRGADRRAGTPQRNSPGKPGRGPGKGHVRLLQRL